LAAGEAFAKSGSTGISLVRISVFGPTHGGAGNFDRALTHQSFHLDPAGNDADFVALNAITLGK